MYGFLECIKEECFASGFNITNILKCTISKGSNNAVLLIRLYQAFSEKKLNILSFYCRNKLIKNYGIFLGKNTCIGKGLVLPHPSSIIIGQEAIIGKNAIIFQNTTIGSKDVGTDRPFYPKIGDNCIVCAGAMILSSDEGLTVGDNSVIGANSILFNSVEENSICYGIPAKVKKRKPVSI